jgi:hypothetical protein
VAAVYTVTDAHRPMSEDIGYRQRRYLISMGIRTACLLVAVILAGHGPVWLLAIMIAAAVVLPYISVVFANGGREPENTGRFDALEAPQADARNMAPRVREDLEADYRKPVSGHSPEIGS